MGKFNHLTGGQTEAILNMVGVENIPAVLRGEKEIFLKDATPLLFDKHGRGIPRNLQSSVCDENRSFYLQQPTARFGWPLECLTAAFPDGTVFCTAEELGREINELKAILAADPRLKHCLNRAWLPLALPKIDAGDYGEVLEATFVVAVEKAYHRKFPKRLFTDHCKSELMGQVNIVHSSHERLVSKMRKGSVAGIFLPNSLQGFSIPACREFADQLPEIFHLAGGYDSCTAMAAYPEVLARDIDVPCYDMAGTQYQAAHHSLYLLQYSSSALSFGWRRLCAQGSHSGGLFIAR